MRSFIKFLIPLFLLLNGCITTPIRPELPTSLNGKGMVIAEPIVVGDFINSLSYADVIINGWKKGNTGRSHLAIVLSPGEYTLDSFQRKLINLSVFPMKLKFTIRPGEVTNLGQILLAYDPEDLGQQRYHIIAVDNTEDTKYFLKTYYPQLFASLGPNSIKLGLDKYVSGKALTQLRIYIAAKLVKRFPHSKNYVVGPVGTIAEIKRNKGKIAGIKLIPSPTMSGIKFADDHGRKDRFAFITADNRLFIIREGKIQQRALPAAEDLNYIFLAGDQDIILCYELFKLQTSNNDGQTWQAFDGAAVTSSQYGKDGFVEGAKGYFLYHSYPARLLYAPYGASIFQNEKLPEGLDVIKRLTLNHSKMFLETSITAWTTKTPHPFFIRNLSGGEWSKKFMPRAMCDPLEFLDDAGMSLRARCDKEIYQSNDGGTNWRLR